MKSTLSDLWHGNIDPINEQTEIDDEKIKELRSNLETCYNILWNRLDTDGKQVLDKLQTCHTELSFLENECSFVQGFSLAVKMMTEALAD